MPTNLQRAELALCFVGLFLSLASWAVPVPLTFIFSVSGMVLSLTMWVRLARRRSGR